MKPAVILSIPLLLVASAGCSGTVDSPWSNFAPSDNSELGNSSDGTGQESEPSQDSAQGIEVDEGLLTVDITFPASLYALNEDELTQEAVDAAAAEEGYLSGTLNSDGSATFTMTKLKQQEMLEEVKRDFDATIQETIADYPNVKSVTRNEDLSEITLEVTEQDLATSFLAFGFSFTAYFYQVLDGKEFATDIVFVDASTGEELSRTSYPLED